MDKIVNFCDYGYFNKIFKYLTKKVDFVGVNYVASFKSPLKRQFWISTASTKIVLIAYLKNLQNIHQDILITRD